MATEKGAEKGTDKLSKVRSVTVHKRDLPLLDGETLREFERSIRDEGGEFLKKELNLGKDDWLWPVDVFGASAVFEVTMSNDSGGGMKLYRVDFTRAADGSFAFTNPVEVRRVISFEPMESGVEKSVLKSASTDDADAVEVLQIKSIWDDVV